jgi:hypothetical protein
MTEYTVFHSQGGKDYKMIGKYEASSPEAAKNKAMRESRYRKNFWVMPTTYISAF